MPEVVQTYVDTHDIAKVVTKQTKIVELIGWTLPSTPRGATSPKSEPIFDAIPSQQQRHEPSVLPSIV